MLAVLSFIVQTPNEFALLPPIVLALISTIPRFAVAPSVSKVNPRAIKTFAPCATASILPFSCFIFAAL